MATRLGKVAAGAGLACIVLMACGDGVFIDTDEDAFFQSPVAVDMSGNWSLSSNPDDPPLIVECTGDLPPEDFTFCDAFTVTVVQERELFTSDPGDGPFCDSFFELVGSATVQEISGVIVRELVDPPSTGSPFQDLEFQAGLVGDRATFALAWLTVPGVDGECMLGGSYIGVRVAAP
jgi:hypothetical protein